MWSVARNSFCVCCFIILQRNLMMLKKVEGKGVRLGKQLFVNLLIILQLKKNYTFVKISKYHFSV